MRISERQLCYLLVVLRDSLPIEEQRFTLPKEDRRKVYEEILRQQSTDLVDVDDNGPIDAAVAAARAAREWINSNPYESVAPSDEEFREYETFHATYGMNLSLEEWRDAKMRGVL